MKKILPFISCILFAQAVAGQIQWQCMDSLFQPLPASVHIYKTTSLLDGKPNIAWYVEADRFDRKIRFDADTTLGRRLTPQAFYEKNGKPLLVVNCTFFSFATNQNLNTVIRRGELVSYNIHTINGRGRDTFTYRHPLGSAIGLTKKGYADIAWLYTDSATKKVYPFQRPLKPEKDSVKQWTAQRFLALQDPPPVGLKGRFGKVLRWEKMYTVVGGGPVLLQNGEIHITNNEEIKFAGKAIEDKHPRTAMGYTNTGKLIVLVIQGRFPGLAEGATLVQEAAMLKELGCSEALNLDGGGSSCMLVNGKETIKPSDKEGQRAVPAVFIIKAR